MSLFRTKEWWTASASVPTECSGDAFVVGNLDNSPGRHDKIAVGTLSGLLRVFYPTRLGVGAIGEESALGTEPLLEMDCGAPILSLACGRFSSSFEGNALAILMHDSLLVCALVAPDTSASQPGGHSGDYLRLQRLYEHTFASSGPHFSASGMCTGVFGASQHGGASSVQLFRAGAPPLAKESVCVLSLDGQLLAYEQERFLFRRGLEGCLMPGPMVYLPATDMILTAASDMTLTAFRYSSLTSSLPGRAATPIRPILGSLQQQQQVQLLGQPQAVPPAQRLQPDWQVNLGEHPAMLLCGAGSSQAPGTLVVISRRWLSFAAPPADAAAGASGGPLALGDSPAGLGSKAASDARPRGLRHQRRLEHTPVAACLVPRPEERAGSSPGHPQHSLQKQGLLLATDDCRMLVFSGEVLVWAAVLPFTPIALAVGTFKGCSGLVALLSPEGQVAVVYCGTEPPQAGGAGSGLASVDTPSRELDYAAIDAEHRALLTKIKQAHAAAAAAGPAGSAPAKTGLLLTVRSTPNRLQEASSAAAPGAFFDDDEYASTASPLHAGPGGHHAATAGPFSSATTPAPVPGFPGAAVGPEGSARSVECARATLPVTLALQCIGKRPVSDVQLVVDPPPWALLPRPLLKQEYALLSADASAPLLLSLPFRCGDGWVASGHPRPAAAFPWSLRVGLCASFRGTEGDTRVAGAAFQLPLCLALRAVPASKDSAAFKVTLDTNRPAPSLAALFADLLDQPPCVLPPSVLARIAPTAIHVLCLEYANGTRATILVSKATGALAGGRFRVQSTALAGLFTVVDALCGRLRLAAAAARSGVTGSPQPPPGPSPPCISVDDDAPPVRPAHAVPSGWEGRPQHSPLTDGEARGALVPAAAPVPPGSATTIVPCLDLAPGFAIAYSDPLPLADVLGAIDRHWAARAALASCLSALGSRALEYRLVLKRLLSRFKDSRAPAPLGGLDALLELVQVHTAEAGRAASEAREVVAAAASDLACVLSLLLVLMKYRFGLRGPTLAAVRACLSPAGLQAESFAPTGGAEGDFGGVGGGGQGWEELADAALARLLKQLASSSGVSGGEEGASALDAVQEALQAAAAGTVAPCLAGDTSSLHRRVTLLCDCLSRGLTLNLNK